MSTSHRVTVNLIGPGRVGRTFARLISSHEEYCLRALHGPEALIEARAFVGAGQTADRLEDLPEANLWLIAVPDSLIAPVAQALTNAGVVPPGAVAAHFSGAGSPELLAPLRSQGASVGCLHPVYSFADPEKAAAGFAGTACAIDGDDAACAMLLRLANALGGKPFRLKPGSKAAYHAALCIASNYLATLSGLALTSAGHAGLDPAQALPLISGLMAQTLDNIAALGPAAALTGPIVRGDVGTVQSHLEALAEDPPLIAAYRRLGLATVDLAGERLSPATQASLRALLNSAATADFSGS